ncbi:MAG: carbamoyltransferase [Myxococcota bacterium]
MTSILGISAFYHDSAAALVVDGDVVAAAQEERFTRKKHDHNFPVHAIEYCLKEAGLRKEQLDYVGFYDKPLLKFERLLETYLAYAPAGFQSFLRAMPVWLRQKLHLPREMRKALDGAYTKRFVFPEHHESHAASAFFPSPFEEAAIVTLDGVGEWATSSWGVGRGNKLELTHELRFPHSIGLLYSAFTYYCGFKVNSGEYKLMGLAPYGEPKYVDKILDNLLDLKEDGSFRMDMSYFNYCQGLTMTSEKFHQLFGRPARAAESKLDQDHMDVAASVQQVTEEIVLRISRHIHKQTGLKNLCMAGGVSLNCVGNGRVLREGPFDDIWIQPAAGDAGGALGTALLIWYQLLDNERRAQKPDLQKASLLGPQAQDDEIKQYLDSRNAVYTRYPSEEETVEAVSSLLAEENVVGWMQGRMEFGPRALGGRSIIGDARSEDMQTTMNLKIKFRESFRPFAPSVLRERVDEFFEMRPNEDSPYMLLVAPVKEEKRLPQKEEHEGLFGIEKLKIQRSVVPAITHVDYSARVQTVDDVRNGRYYKLIKKFEEKTGSPVIINTSFNVRGEPIVCTPADAYRCFMGTHMDVLVIENYVLHKTDQPKENAEDYLGEFALD